MLFRGWFGDPYNTLVKRMYQEVDFTRRSAAVRKTGRREEAVSACATQDQHRREILQWTPLSKLREMAKEKIEERKEEDDEEIKAKYWVK